MKYFLVVLGLGLYANFSSAEDIITRCETKGNQKLTYEIVQLKGAELISVNRLDENNCISSRIILEQSEMVVVGENSGANRTTQRTYTPVNPEVKFGYTSKSKISAGGKELAQITIDGLSTKMTCEYNTAIKQETTCPKVRYK